MITAAQLRRALLCIDQKTLAELSGLSFIGDGAPIPQVGVARG
jgi:hypothetical protein